MTIKEKMAILAVVVYLSIMTTGMAVMHFCYGITYPDPKMLEVLVYFQIFATLSACFFYRKFFRGTGFKKPVWNIYIVEFLIVALTMGFLQITTGDYTHTDMKLLWTIVGTMLLVGIGEEMLFRGILFTAFRERQGVYKAILISAGVFGFLHSTNLVGGEAFGATVLQVFSAAVAGVLNAWVFYKTKNLIPTMLYHWCFDMFILLGMIAPANTETVSGIQSILTTGAALVILGFIAYRLVKKMPAPEDKPFETQNS